MTDIPIPSTIEQLVQYLSSGPTAEEQNHVLKTVGPKDANNTFLAAPLPSGEDPLTVLPLETNTLGWLYILCVFYVRLLRTC